MSNALRIAHGLFGRVALLDMDGSLVRHAHPHCHVLIKAEGADTAFAVGNELVALTDSQAVLVNAFEPHAYVHDPQRPRTTILALYIEPEWLGAFRANWAASAGPRFFEKPAGQLTPQIQHIARDLTHAMLADPGATQAHERLLSALMIAVVERFTAWRNVGGSLRECAAALAPPDFRIRRAVAAMRAAPGAICSVDALAREAGLSRAHFYRLFARAGSVSPHLYLNVLRMELAVDAIVHRPDSLADLSSQLGFSAPAHFSRFFRDHAGVRPSEFRSVARLGAALDA